MEDGEQKKAFTPETREIAESLLTLDQRKRLLIFNAALTKSSRAIFHQCLDPNNRRAESDLEKMRRIYFHIAENFYLSVYKTPKAQAIVDLFALYGSIDYCQDIMSSDIFTRFMSDLDPKHFNQTTEFDMMSSQGLLAYLYKYSSFEEFRDGTKPVLNMVKAQYDQGAVTHFFGNVACANFTAALITNYCQAPFTRFHLYQYSRKAALRYGPKFGEFQTLESQFAGINRSTEGICIVDGFCASGESIEKSIDGFRKNGFNGQIFVFIGYGSYPTIHSHRTEQLYPQKRLFPGEEAEDSMFLRVV